MADDFLRGVEQAPRRVDVLAASERIEIAALEQGLHESVAAADRHPRPLRQLAEQHGPAGGFEGFEDRERAVGGADA